MEELGGDSKRIPQSYTIGRRRTALRGATEEIKGKRGNIRKGGFEIVGDRKRSFRYRRGDLPFIKLPQQMIAWDVILEPQGMRQLLLRVLLLQHAGVLRCCPNRITSALRRQEFFNTIFVYGEGPRYCRKYDLNEAAVRRPLPRVAGRRQW